MSDELFMRQELARYQAELTRRNQEMLFYLLKETQKSNQEKQAKIEEHFIETQCLQYLIDALVGELAEIQREV